MANIIYERWADARDCERKSLQLNQNEIALKCALLAVYFENLMILEYGMTMGEYFLSR